MTDHVRRLLAANAVSSLGDGLQVAALPLAGASLTSSPATIAALAAVGSVPALLGAVPAGALADRLPRARLMTALDLAQAAVLAALAVLIAAHALAVWELFATALLMGIGQMLTEISAAALVPVIAPADRLPRVNAILATTTEMGGGLAGPAAGGVLFAVAAGLPFALNAFSFLAAGLIIAALTQPEKAARARHQALGPAGDARLRAGVAWLARHRPLRGLVLMVAAWSLFGWMPEAVLVLYVREDLHGSSAAFGGLLAATSVGATLGGLLADRLIARLGTGRILAPSLLIYAVLMVPPAFLASVYPVALVFFGQGLPVLVFTVAAAIARQTLTPRPLMARVTSVFYLAGAGIAPVGLLAGGFIGAHLGLRATFLVGGIGLAASVALLSRTVRGIDQPARADRHQG